MRKLIVTATTVLTIALIAISLHALATAMDGDDGEILPMLFASPIDPPSTIAGTVFQDANGDGEQDAGELGIQDVTVELDNSITGSITTDPNGNYSFNLAWSGYYTVTAVTPVGYVSTTPGEVVARLTGPSQRLEVDFGFRGIGTIRGVVFDDRNINGVQDEGEPGISGVTIALLQDGAGIDSTTTAGDGSYAFTSVFLGNYTVEETDLPDYTSETPNVQPVSLTTPGQEEIVNFGDYGPSRVTGIVFNDIDGDRSKDSNEQGIAGVPIDLLFEGTLQMSKSTDSNGVYFFLWEDLGNYTVQETNLEGYVSTSDDEVEISKDEPNQVEVVNFADRGIGIIHGTVFDDQNGNEEQDTGEAGIDDVTVKLVQDETVIRAVTTGSDGYYEFIALGLDEYTVQEMDREGYNSTTPNTVTTTLTINKQAAEVNFGDRGIGTVRGTVFDDQNGDGHQDVGEPGINGVTVRLLQDDTAVLTETTASGGMYKFDPVWLGDYTVKETDREGYTSTTSNVATVSLTMTQQVEVRNFGDRGVGTVAGIVFSDENGNQEQDEGEPGLPGVSVTLLRDSSTISTTTTAGDGSYAFTSQLLGDYTVRERNPDGYISTTDDEVAISLTAPGQLAEAHFGDRPAGAIMGTVFSDENSNMVQDGEEQGIVGVTITLVQDGRTISVTSTISDGVYVFDPVWLGRYTVEETDREGYVSTTGNVATVSLTTAEQVVMRNFGDRAVGTIAGMVFSDRNGNGTYDGTEQGIGGVTVTLLQEGSALDTTTTDVDGSYAFPSLFLGDYTVEETNLDGYTSTTDDRVDVSLATPGEERIVDFGDRRFFVFLPMVLQSYP